MRVLYIGFTLALALGGCDRCGAGNEAIDAAPLAVEPPPPAPENLLADVYMPTPNATWSKLQRGIGGAVGILPASAGGIAALVLGLDVGLGSEIDGQSPAYGVVVGEPESPSTAFAMKLTDLRHARSLLVDGDTARFTGRESPGMTELLPKDARSAGDSAVALTKNGYLVFTRRSADLARLGGYVTRTLPAKALPSGAVVVEVPRAALQKVIAPRLASLWSDAKGTLLTADARDRQQHGGKAPDFGDPQAIVGVLDGLVSTRIAIVGDLDHVRVGLDIGDDGATVLATMTAAGPAATAWIDGMLTGAPDPLLALPATSALCVLTRDAEPARAAQHAGLEAGLAASFGVDAKKIHPVIEELGKARGDVVATSFSWDEPRGVFLRVASRDDAAAASLMKDGVELLRGPPFKDLLRAQEIARKTEGTVETATLVRAKPAAPFGVSWSASAGALAIAAGGEPAVTLRNGDKPERSLGEEPSVKGPLAILGTTASTVVVAQPLRFDPRRANLPTSPLVVSVGKNGGEAYLRADVTQGLLRELARWQLGL